MAFHAGVPQPAAMDRGVSAYRVMKWTLFAVLVLVAPAPVVAFQSFLTGPVIFVLAQLLYMTVDIRPEGGVWHGQIIGYFAVHLVMYGALYYALAAGMARLVALAARPWVRAAALTALCFTALALAALPLYGGAGIYGGSRGSLFRFFAVLETTHFGPNAALKIYGPALAVLGALALWRLCRPRPGTR